MLRPHLTVACVIERDGRFLMVEERQGAGLVYNQPAGHVEPGEGLLQAAVRETMEETGYLFRPAAVVGIYRWTSPADGTPFLRICYTGVCDKEPAQAVNDAEVLRALWLSREELAQGLRPCRSPLVLGAIDDYLGDKRYPLDICRELGETAQPGR